MSTRPAAAAARALVVAVRLCLKHHAGDRAAALSFASLMSMLPLLLIALASLTALGVTDATRAQVRRAIVDSFLPTTAEALVTATEESFQVFKESSGTLSLTGLVLLLFAAGQLFSNLNRVFRDIWGTHGLRARLPRLVGFWLLVLIAPPLVAIPAYLGRLVRVSGWTAPHIALSWITGTALFLAAYLIFPGRRIRLGPALAAAATAGFLWLGLKALFTTLVKRAFVASAILGALGFVPALLLWLHFSWTVFLFGAELCLALEDPEIARIRAGVAGATDSAPSG